MRMDAFSELSSHVWDDFCEMCKIWSEKHIFDNKTECGKRLYFGLVFISTVC